MKSSVYVTDRQAAPASSSRSTAPTPPAGGWALVPAVDDLVALAASLNVPGEPLVFIDGTV